MDKLNLNEARASSRLQHEAQPTAVTASSPIVQAYQGSSESLTGAELQRRAQFMEKQRQLLTEKKRAERARQLEQYMASSKAGGGGGAAAQARPMSSRAARSVLKGAEAEDLPQASLNAKSVTDEERKRVEARRALAETLKREVISQAKR